MATDGSTTKPDATLGDGKAGTPQTITREEHEKALRDATSAILADVGRQKKSADDAMRAAQAAQARLDNMIKEQERAELEAARNDPDKLTLIQERQRRKTMESDLAAAKQELNDKTNRLTQYESREAESARENRAKDIADRLNVNPAVLMKMSKFTDGTPEAIEEIARELPKKTGGGGFKPDSNLGVGGGSSWDQIRANYIKDPRNPSAKAQYEAALRERGH